MNFSFFNKNTLIFPLKLGPPNNKLSKIIKIRQKKIMKKSRENEFFHFLTKNTLIYPIKLFAFTKHHQKLSTFDRKKKELFMFF